MKNLADQFERDRFTMEINQHFSVIAPAGVGKTHSIVARVARMIAAGQEPIALVTYTKKAAEEMRQRLEAYLKKEGKMLPYEKIFIGTIHALCLELMREHSQEWNLPTKREVFGDVGALYARWTQENPNPLKMLPAEAQERFLRYFENFDHQLLIQVAANENTPKELCAPPNLDFTKLFQGNIEKANKRTYDRLRKWA